MVNLLLALQKQFSHRTSSDRELAKDLEVIMGMYKRMWIMLLILCIAGAGVAYAQFSGAIEGTIQDPTGAVVPRAKITLSNLATGVTAVTQTNASGYYRFPSLGPGSYKVTAQAPGFSVVT